MTKFTDNLIKRLASKHLLLHPFYQGWTDGTISRETLRNYASQYYHHVSAFPRYLSATHSGCADLATRQLLLENLNDEERGAENHPELWLRFAEELGLDREQVKNQALQPETQALIESFMTAARSSYEEGLGALLAYEHQVPQVATFKMDALKKHYGFAEGCNGLTFFDVHRKADVYHTEALKQALDQLPPAAQAKAEAAATIASTRLWEFLDGIHNRAAA